MRAAIVVPVITQLVEEARAAFAAANEADALGAAFEKKLGEQREIMLARRIELGMVIRRAHDRLPRHSRTGNSFDDFLGAIEMSSSTAYKYMHDAGWTSGRVSPRHGDQGADVREIPAPTDADAPPEAAAELAEDEVEIDRDTWCTPKWITEAIGEFDLDPCANERSHVQAIYSYRLDQGQDGLKLRTEKWMDASSVRVFVNPPYSDVRPWVEAFARTRFCFLLKLDPSTKWFAELWRLAEIVLVPKGTRVEFEPPPNVPRSGSNPFPHGLFYARESDATAAIRNLCFPPWRTK